MLFTTWREFDYIFKVADAYFQSTRMNGIWKMELRMKKNMKNWVENEESMENWAVAKAETLKKKKIRIESMRLEEMNEKKWSSASTLKH